MLFSRLLCTAFILANVLGVPALHASDFEPGNIQIYFGGLELDDQSVDWEELSDGELEVDFSTLLSVGAEGEYLLHNGWLHAGVNPGGSLSWTDDQMVFSGLLKRPELKPVDASLDNTLWLFELHLGGYVRGRLHDRITTYAAAGPMVMFGHHEIKDEKAGSVELDLSDDSGSDFNLGYYARAGIDFEFEPNRHLGFGLRYQSSELDFSDTVGSVDIEGHQWLFSYTQRW